MMECWQFGAASRPSFTDICSTLRVILEHTAEYYGYINPIDEKNNNEQIEEQLSKHSLQDLETKRSMSHTDVIDVV